MRSNKNKRQCSSEVYVREKQFNNRYLNGEHSPKYEALLDPHSTYYFSSKSVKNHLKQMKRSLRFQKKSSQSFYTSNLIGQRIKQKYQLINPKAKICSSKISTLQKQGLEKLSNCGIKPILFSYLNRQKDEKQQKAIDFQNPEIKRQGSSENVFRRKQYKPKSMFKSSHQQYTNHLFEQLHQKKHTKWKDFIHSKIKELSKHQIQQRATIQ